MEQRFAAGLRPHRAHCHARFGGLRSGISLASFAISSKTRWNSSSPEEGIMTLSYLHATSSVMRKNGPRGFSLSAKVNILVRIWSCSDFNISSAMRWLLDCHRRKSDARRVKAVRSRSYLSFVWLARHRRRCRATFPSLQHDSLFILEIWHGKRRPWADSAAWRARTPSARSLAIREGPDFFSGTQPSASWVAASWPRSRAHLTLRTARSNLAP